MVIGSAMLVLAIGVLLAIFVRIVLLDSLGKETHKRAQAVARHFTELAMRPLSVDDTQALQQLVNDQYLMSEDDIYYIFVVDRNGKVLAHSFGGLFPQELSTVIGTADDEICLDLKAGQQNEHICNFSVQIQKGAMGAVHVGHSDQVVQQYVHNVLALIFPFVILTLAIGTVGALLFSGVITRPVSVLGAGIEKAARGELDCVIPVSSHDELGVLAGSFNKMVENLRQTTVSREYMEKLLNTMNDVLAVISPDGVVTSVNRAYCGLLGVQPSEVVGRRVQDFRPDEAPSRMFAAYEQSQKDGKVQGIECTCRSASGAELPLLLSLAVMHGDDGVPQAVVCAAQDISAIKEVQSELHSKQDELEGLNQRLEDLVASRTAELAITNEGLRSEVAERKRTSEELGKARDVAEAANVAKTEFLANMSHEMRTPLNAIIGGTEYLQDAELLPEQRRCLEMIHQAGESLLVQVSDLIDLSRIETGQLELKPKEFNLADLIEKVVRMLAREAQRKGIDLRFSMPADLPHFVIGDRLRLQQVLINLAGNALKFTGDGGKVVISARCGAPAGDGSVPVTFAVRDSGIGIEADKLGVIFEPFVQADSSITRRFGGSGLGLSISRRLIAAMGGNIGVESTPGAGSLFSFTLNFPLASKPPVRPGLQSRQESRAASRGDSSGGTEKPLVLLVDDSDENRELLRLFMLSQPFVLMEASGGDDALRLFEQHEFALVLMDIQMPGMDGLTATRLMRAIDQRSGRHTPIVALTAHAYEDDVNQCLEAGCDGHIAKPFKKKVLFRQIEQYVRGA